MGWVGQLASTAGTITVSTATAILDRLLHHAVTFNIRGDSYRLREELKAGLVHSHDDNTSQPGGEI